MTKKIITNSFAGNIEAETIEYSYEDEIYTGALFTINLPYYHNKLYLKS